MPSSKREPSKELLTTISSNIKKLRKKKGLTQEQLAEVSGYHTTFISLIERNQRNITISTVEVLANGLGVEPYTLLKP